MKVGLGVQIDDEELLVGLQSRMDRPAMQKQGAEQLASRY
jgi:hypothetical protein